MRSADMHPDSAASIARFPDYGYGRGQLPEPLPAISQPHRPVRGQSGRAGSGAGRRQEAACSLRAWTKCLKSAALIGRAKA